jgi:hypothetical protein
LPLLLPPSFLLLQFIMKCAMARLPNQPYLLTLYSNFIIEVHSGAPLGFMFVT